MLNYQTTSFHDTLYLRKILGLKAAPEFEQWLKKMNIMDSAGQVRPISQQHPLLQQFPNKRAS